MTYNPHLINALVAIAQNQAKFPAKQPPDLFSGATASIVCDFDGSNPASAGLCGKPFNPTREEKDRDLWCEHEHNAMPIFRAIEGAAKKVQSSKAYDKFCADLFSGLVVVDSKGSNVKLMSRGCYKICRPKSWKCNAGAWQNLKDVFRISIEFENIGKLYAGAEKLVQKVGVIGSSSGVAFEDYTFGPIYRIKDRFATPPTGIIVDERLNPAHEAEVIYKDYQVILGCRGPNLRFTGDKPYLIELQLHVASMLKAKHDAGHALYKQMRVLSEVERSKLLPLVVSSNNVYGVAFQQNFAAHTGLNAEIDYIGPSLIEHVASLNLEPTYIVNNWSEVLEGIYSSIQTAPAQ
ncbi:MAG: hypothetical protein VYA34_02365 [Myxococcota bacterium]|nr:hypothetical protein [Myxococcota bacterium]